MPIYEYSCNACNTVFEEWHRHADDIREQPCPKCHKAARRLISNTSFVLKGGGWYVTEYGNRKSESAPAATETPAAAPESQAAPASAPAESAPPPPAAKAEPSTAQAS